ncbi:MAG: YIP1 family protein [Archaeoglobaceae archaeon]|nr:YIP1 family protein [Archaeoglobaceae archaeon]MCX8152772.1 YIP1 family protein [Archaeoglobaceae archaeon]MDW8013479.1 Yip1 family protein [Archaeoglobaceae archaeon]
MDLLLNPDKFLKKDFSWRESLVVILLGTVVSLIVAFIVAQSIAEEIKKTLPIPEAEIIAAFTYISIIVGAPISIVFSWVVFYTAIPYIVARILSGTGKFSSTMKKTAFAFVPNIILSPVSVILAYEKLEMVKYGIFVTPSEVMISVVAALWSFIYLTFAVKHVMQLTIKKAIASAAIPLIITVVGQLLSIYIK